MNYLWSNLPNAPHIDWVLSSLKDNPDLWAAAGDAAWVAILALVTYDDCDEYLNMSYEELRIWAALSEHSAAVLLQPVVYVKNHSERSFC